MIKIDFRLFQVSVELQTLQEHLNATEGQILQGERDAQAALDLQLSELGPQDQGDWQLAKDAHDFQVKIVLPRIMRNPFWFPYSQYTSLPFERSQGFSKAGRRSGYL